MKKERLKVIKEAEVTNNCPECFNQNMRLNFYQKHLHSRFYHRITTQVTHQLKCHTCNSIIYPINWTDDIERIVDYYQKMVKPETATIKFTVWFYLLIVLILAIGVALGYLYKTGIIAF